MRRHLLLFFVVFGLVFLHRFERLHSRTWLMAGNAPVSLYLHRAMTSAELADSMRSLGWVRDPEQWEWVASTHGWKRYRKGHYLVEADRTIRDLTRDLALGIQTPVDVVILPGLDSGRLAALLSRQLAADSLEFMEVFSKNGDSAGERAGVAAHVLPDTYSMYWTSTAEAVVTRLERRLRSELDALLGPADANPAGLTEQQILTLASIVEWEARYEDEKPVIAGLYLNRLRRGMPLQADPTVSFAIGERRRLYNDDYRVDHPYNTYLRQGLPPGPINNPSMSSIRAVVRPETHDYLFMVATQDGRHAFNATYDAHLEAVRQWQIWIREQFRIKRQREAEEQAAASGSRR